MKPLKVRNSYKHALLALTFSGTIPTETIDFLVNGIGLNITIKKLILINVNFLKTTLNSWTFCFGLNSSITTLESIHLLSLFEFYSHIWL
jgi:hypothetical protein